MAKKAGMTQVYNSKGMLVPITLLLLAGDEDITFEEGAKLVVSGISKGKGFQGAVKRHGFKGAPKTHGHKHDLRRVGSIGSGFPERVWKGRRMPGHMGSQGVTIKNLEIVRIDKEHNIIGLKGAIPGAVGSMVKIRV